MSAAHLATAAADNVVAWALTFLIASTVLLGAARLAARPLAERPGLRQALWRTAVLGALASPLIQSGLGAGPVRPLPFRSAPAAGAAGVRIPGEAAGPAPGEAAPGATQGGAAPEATRVARADGSQAPPPVRDTARESGEAATGSGPAGAPGESAPGGTAGPPDGAPPRGPPPPAGTPEAASDPVSLPPAEPWTLWAALAWLAAGLFGLVHLAGRHAALLRTLGPRRAVRDPDLLAELETLAKEFHLRRLPLLTESRALRSPAVLPAGEICLPADRFFLLSPARRRAVLAHELAHLERRDPLWQAALAVVGAVLPFQPLVRRAAFELRTAAEALADERAVLATGDPGALAGALGQVAGWVGPGDPRGWSLGLALEAESDLVRRVRRVLSGARMREERSAPAVAALGLLAALGCLAAFVPAFAPPGTELAEAPGPAAAAGGAEPHAPTLDRRSPMPTSPIDQGAASAPEPTTSLRSPASLLCDEAVRHSARSRVAGAVQAAAVTAALLLAACEGSGPGGAVADTAHTVRDSAGVDIVESRGPAWRPGEGWTLAPEPTLRLGVVEGDPVRQFSRIGSLARLPDGRIAVLETQAREVRIFGPEGTHLRTLGGPGEGPGELRSARWMEALPDGTLQVQGLLDRVRYSPDGGLVAHETLDWNRVVAVGLFSTECGGLPNFHGDHVLLCPRRSNDDLPQEGFHRPLDPVVRLPFDLSRADTLGVVLGLEQYALPVQGQRSFVIHPLYGRGLHTLSGERLYLGETSRYRIEVWNLHGTLERVISRPGTARAPTADEIERGYQAAARMIFRDAGNVALVRGRIHVPDSVAPPRGLTVDSQGHLWVHTVGLAPDESGGWWFEVFDPEGRLLGGVSLPAGLRPFEIGRDYVLGVRSDELQVPFVELYALRR